jgi:hypothetical protein
MSKSCVNGVYDEHAKRSTIYINQKAYCFYVFWRCCFYREGTDFPKLYCPVRTIYSTYYKIAQMFDLVVDVILPHHIPGFLRSFEHDGVLSVVEKQRKKSDEFIPCCVISPKWAFWYQGLISGSIVDGCKDMVLRHVDRKVVPYGKSIAQLNADGFAHSSDLSGGPRRRTVLFSQRRGEQVRRVTPTIVITKPPNDSGDDDHGHVVYDNTPEDILKYEEASEEASEGEEGSMMGRGSEESKAVERMHHAACEPNPPTSGQEEVYRYIHQLRTGRLKPMISPRASTMSMEQLGEEYLSRREEMDKSFSKKRKNRDRKRRKLKKEQERERRGTKGVGPRPPTSISTPVMHTIVVSKHIAWIHLRLQESSFRHEIDQAISHTTEISEYVALYPTEESEPSGNGNGKTKKRKQKKRKSEDTATHEISITQSETEGL